MAGVKGLGLLALAAGHAAAWSTSSEVAGRLYSGGAGGVVPSNMGINPAYAGLAVDTLTGLPVAPITLDDIVLAVDKAGNAKCCPRGTIFNGETCVFPSSAVCPPGFRVNGHVCTSIDPPPCPGDLVYDDGVCISRRPPLCPALTTFNPATFRCEADTTPGCTPPLVREGDACVSATGPQCNGQGFKLENGLCISTTAPTCGSDELVLDKLGRCVSRDGPGCPPRTKPVPGNVCEHEDGPQCAGDLEYKQGSCVHRGNPSCPDGTKWSDNVCQQIADPTCKTGIYKNGICESEEGPQCPPLHELAEDGVCKYEDTAFCNKLLKRIYDEHKIPLCCPKGEGMRAENGQCVTMAFDSECPIGMSFDNINNRCVADPGALQCPQGAKLNQATLKCEFTTPPKCAVGTPSQGRCVLSDSPDCGPDATFDGKTGTCISRHHPECPPNSFPSGIDCISTVDFPACPPQTHPDGKGQCISTTLPTCPPTTTISDGSCVHPVNPICPDGTTVSGPNCISPGVPLCPSNTHWDPATAKCISTDRPTCVPPFIPSGDKCISPDTAKCPPTFTLDPQGRCISNHRPTCPPNSTYVPLMGRCVSSSPPECPGGQLDGTGHCLHGAPQCPGTTALIDGVCVSSTDPGCPADTELDKATGRCVALDGPHCPDGTHLDGDRCVAVTVPLCPEGTTPSLWGKCVADRPPNCEADDGDLVFDPVRNTCVSRGDPKCPVDTVYDPEGRRCVTISRQACFDLRTCPPVEDVLPRLGDSEPEVRQAVPVVEAPAVPVQGAPVGGESPSAGEATPGEPVVEGQGAVGEDDGLPYFDVWSGLEEGDL